MALENLSKNAKEIYASIQELIKSNLEYYRLSVLKKSAKGTISAIQVVLLGSVFFFLISFLSLAFAFWIGEAINSISGGFFIVAGFYLVLMLLAYWFTKTKLEKMVLNKFSEKMYPSKEKKDNDDEKV